MKSLLGNERMGRAAAIGAALVTAALAAACSSGGDTSKSTATSGGTGGEAAAASSSTGTGGDATATTSVPAGDCFTFATKQSQPYTTACGDFMAMMGANVDLNSGAGSSQLCQLSGTYTSLSAVPKSLGSCQWATYIEGGAGLANTGIIVEDSTGAHHYRMWIKSNKLPDLVFDFDQID